MSMLDELKRMLSDPGGALRDMDPAVPPSMTEDRPPVWHFSSFELMNGVDVSDCPDAIAGDPFNRRSSR